MNSKRRGSAAQSRDSVPLVANGLDLRVTAIIAGPLAPAVMLRVVAGGRETSVGATIGAQHAEALAAAILAAAKRAAEAAMFAPITEATPRGA